MPTTPPMVYYPERRQYVEKFVIDLDSDSDSESEYEYDEDSSGHVPDEVSKCAMNVVSETENSPLVRRPTALEHLTTELRICIADQCHDRKRVIIEKQIISHLHDNAVTLTEVKLLIPECERHCGIVNKLATNIGWWHSRGRISQSDLETILEYIFLNDDENYSLFHSVHEKVTRFRLERRNRGSQRRRRKGLRHWEQHICIEAGRQSVSTKKERHQISQRVREFPSKYRKPLQFLSAGAKTIAEMYVKVWDLSWVDVKHLNRTQNGLFKRTLKPLVDLTYNSGKWKEQEAEKKTPDGPQEMDQKMDREDLREVIRANLPPQWMASLPNPANTLPLPMPMAQPGILSSDSSSSPWSSTPMSSTASLRPLSTCPFTSHHQHDYLICVPRNFEKGRISKDVAKPPIRSPSPSSPKSSSSRGLHLRLIAVPRIFEMRPKPKTAPYSSSLVMGVM